MKAEFEQIRIDDLQKKASKRSKKRSSESSEEADDEEDKEELDMSPNFKSKLTQKRNTDQFSSQLEIEPESRYKNAAHVSQSQISGSSVEDNIRQPMNFEDMDGDSNMHSKSGSNSGEHLMEDDGSDIFDTDSSADQDVVRDLEENRELEL